MNMPFYFTVMRVIMGPIFLLFYLYGGEWGIDGTYLPYFLLAIIALCELSDIFDGFLARRHNKVTDLGKVLDPMADSIFRLSVFLAFTQGIVQLPLIIVLVFFLRDSVIGTLRTLCALQGVALGARFSGKIKAVVQAVAALLIVILMIPYTEGCLEKAVFQKISLYTAGIAALYTLISGVEYLWVYRRHINKYLSRL
jgi:CDP-diacylglycerol--glycerol-3-phosphate 3-phosphatidyltransferase